MDFTFIMQFHVHSDISLFYFHSYPYSYFYFILPLFTICISSDLHLFFIPMINHIFVVFYFISFFCFIVIYSYCISSHFIPHLYFVFISCIFY